MPDIEKICRVFFEVTVAQKVVPAATATASSPGGSPSVQSLPGAQLSKGLNASMDGASELDWLAYSAPCTMMHHHLFILHWQKIDGVDAQVFTAECIHRTLQEHLRVWHQLGIIVNIC